MPPNPGDHLPSQTVWLLAFSGQSVSLDQKLASSLLMAFENRKRRDYYEDAYENESAQDDGDELVSSKLVNNRALLLGAANWACRVIALSHSVGLSV